MNQDTICALATANGIGAIGIIRVSGEQAIEICEKCFDGKALTQQKSHTVHYGFIKDGDEVIDEVMVSIFLAPKSFTTENSVEISFHGSPHIGKRILEVLIKNGARMAKAGEFTMRAFMNGRIDLSQAESIADLIASENEASRKVALQQLKGGISQEISVLRNDLLNFVSLIELELDFAEEDVEFADRTALVQLLQKIESKLKSLIDSFQYGNAIKSGVAVAIIGKPNAGKSSVLNVLLGEERAIVTDIAGTTRDTLEESIQIKGIPLNIIDTAGIRDTNDLIEKIGVDKAKDLLTKADLVLYVVDTSDPLTKDDEEIMELIEDKQTIVLLNKADLDQVVKVSDLKEKGFEQIVQISAKEQTGIEELYQLIQDIFFEGHVSFNDEIYLTNMRHKTEVSEALKSLAMVLQSIEDGMPEDFFSIDLLDAYEHLGFITGESVGEDLVNEIFAEFCMGK